MLNYSDILLKNIEALADDEDGETVDCYTSITPVEGGKVVYCGTCSNEDGYGPFEMADIQPLGGCTKN